MKIYIAGKITGDPKYRDRFREEAERLEGLGHIVLNPAELPEGMSKAEYMRICFAMIDCADTVFLLPIGRAAQGRGWSRPIAATSASPRTRSGRRTHERQKAGEPEQAADDDPGDADDLPGTSAPWRR